MEASPPPPTPTLDSLIFEVQALAQHAVEVLKGNPKVQEVVAKIEAAEAAIQEARAEQPEETA
jgi:hypothetical protein